jgi:periplasmic protein TonB
MNDLGNLCNCVMEHDAVAAGNARLLRRKALVGSIFLETALIGTMLLWPLITPGVLPQQMSVTPLPPYHGSSNSEAIRSPHMIIDRMPPIAITNVSHPVAGHGRAVEAVTGEPPIPGEMDLGRRGSGPLIPGGSTAGRSIEIAPPTANRRPLQVSRGVMEARLVHRVQPDYPMPARILHLAGTVELEAIIGTDGSIRQLEVLSGNPILAQAAREAVQQWRYQPTLLNGQAVEVETHVTVTFVMQ